MASSSSSIRDGRPELGQPQAQVTQREGKGEEAEETRDWAALPVDALLAVLGRLGGVDILIGAGHVCRPWRRATREEPELWRCVDMRRRARLAYDVDLRAAARAAVTRSGGRCEAFLAEDSAGAGLGYDDDFFIFLADASGPIGGCECKCTEVVRMHGLRSLQLFANSIGNQELEAILDGCQQLESLDIRHCFNVLVDDEMWARCARLNTLRLPEDSMEDYDLPYDSPVRDCINYSGVMY
ncbi:unnamed protein product [Urochloa humidicola]